MDFMTVNFKDMSRIACVYLLGDIICETKILICVYVYVCLPYMSSPTMDGKHII